MRYMNLEGHTHTTIDVGGYRYNNKGCCKNFTFLNFINRARTTIIEVPMQA